MTYLISRDLDLGSCWWFSCTAAVDISENIIQNCVAVFKGEISSGVCTCNQYLFIGQ
jgi:hypothetical protein